MTSPRQKGSLGIRRTAAWSNRQPRGRRRREHPPSSRRCAPRHTGGQRPGRRHGCGRALVCGLLVKSPLWYGPGLCDERPADDGSTRRRASSVEAVGLPRRSSLRAHSRSAPSAHMLILQRYHMVNPGPASSNARVPHRLSRPSASCPVKKCLEGLRTHGMTRTALRSVAEHLPGALFLLNGVTSDARTGKRLWFPAARASTQLWRPAGPRQATLPRVTPFLSWES